MYKKTQSKSDKVLELYNSGVILTKICVETKTSQKTVKKILFSHGINYDELEELKYREKLKLAIKLYEEGKAQIQIEQELNLTRKTLRKLFKEQAKHYKTKSEQWRIRYGNTLREDAFELITPESAYWIGMLYADGHIGSGRREFNVELGLHSNDIEHLKKYQNFLGANGKMSPAPKQDYIRVKIGCERLYKSLQNLGFTNNKSLDAKPHNSVEDDRNFWRGCVDGDGGIYNPYKTKKGKSPRQIFLCGTLDTVIGFIVFCEKNSKIINRKFPTKANGKELYEISYYGKEAEMIAELLYKDTAVYLDRKYAVYLSWNINSNKNL